MNVRRRGRNSARRPHRPATSPSQCELDGRCLIKLGLEVAAREGAWSPRPGCRTWQSRYYHLGQRSGLTFQLKCPILSGGRVGTIQWSAVVTRHCAYHLPTSPFTGGETEAQKGHVPTALVGHRWDVAELKPTLGPPDFMCHIWLLGRGAGKLLLILQKPQAVPGPGSLLWHSAGSVGCFLL